MTRTLRRDARGSGGGSELLDALNDEIDRTIVSALVADGRCTLKQLARQCGLSISAVQARVRRLTADGVIRGYTAILDHEALGLPLAAFVAVTPIDLNELDDIPARLSGIPQIERCCSTAGDDSYMLFVRAASTNALDDVLHEIRRQANVSTHTTMVLHTFFDRHFHF